MPAILLRALVICAICLLPPTFLMGASLPAIARWIEATPRGVSWLGLLYGGNTAGAVFGCLLAGFYLLRVFDMAIATSWRRRSTCAVALVSFWPGQAHAGTRRRPMRDRSPAACLASAQPPGRSISTIALSGATALGAEVVWTRLLGLMLGATVYTFSIILAVFLVGHRDRQCGGLDRWRATRATRGVALGWCQTAARRLPSPGPPSCLRNSLPYWPVNPLLSTSPWYTFQIDLVRVSVGDPAAALLVGRKLSAGARRRRGRGEDDPAQPGRRASTPPTPAARFWARSLQPDPDPVDRHSGLPSRS